MLPDASQEPAVPKAEARADLSEREQEILKLVATGATNKQIAQQLVISPNTVKVHLRNIFGKIGVASRTEAALYAIRSGWVEVAGELKPIEEDSSTLTDLEPPPNGAPQAANTAVVAAAVEAGASTVPTNGLGLPARRTRRWVVLAALLAILVLVVTGATWYARNALATPTATRATIVVPQWQTLAPLPTARSGLAAVAYENNIYAIAGEAPNGVTGVAERYDPAANTWTALAPKPLPVADVGAAVIGGRIYVPGGRQASGAPTSEVEDYDIAGNVWARAAPLPQAISGYALVAHEGRLYLFGGWDGHQYLSSAYVYDPAQDQWKALASMPSARGYAGAAEASGRIYVIGGYNGQQAIAGSEIFLPERQNGDQSPWETAIPLPQPRYASGVAGLADVVYTVGGETAVAQDVSVLGYSPSGKGWQPLQVPPTAGWSHMGLVALGSRLFVVGGRKDGAVTNVNLMCQVVYAILLPVVQ